MEKKLLFVILCLGIFLRFFQLGSVPVSLNLDEVAIGYNSYSILKTARDEYGTFLPVAFRSHDDYKAPFYIYVTTLPIALFGLNPFAIRFISALAGSLTLLFTYLLTKELIKAKDNYFYLPVVTTFLLAISPWHIQFSRAAYETNLAVLFLVLGAWTFLKGLSNPKFYTLAVASYALSLYTYHSTKIFLPLFGLVLAYLYRHKLWQHKKYLIFNFILGLLLVMPLIQFSLTAESKLRFQGTNVFSTPTFVEVNQDLKIDQWREGREYQAKLFHNKYLSGFWVIAKGYFSHFSYDFLFYGGKGMPVHHAPNVSLLYLWELPFILMGLYALFAHRIKSKWLILSWLLLAPIGAALTYDIPSSTRTEIMLPIWQILTGLGLIFYLRRFSGGAFLKRIAVLIPMVLFFLIFYLHNYFRVADLLYASGWQYGYKEAIEFVEANRESEQRVIYSTNLKQPQNFVAFYTAYDPKTYIEIDGGTVSGGFNEDKNAFGVYAFKPIDWNNLQPNTFFVDTAEKFPTNLYPIETIYHPNGQPLIMIYKTASQ